MEPALRPIEPVSEMPDASQRPAGPWDFGFVVIGRNEGARLVACLRSLEGSDRPIVYVDSGSSDDSVAASRKAGALIEVLDPSQPFTAARARNVGFESLRRRFGQPRYVQFLDGDCQQEEGWPEFAAAFLDANPQIGGVCGRRRETDAGASIYNEMCDVEWGREAGQAHSFGGDVMIRTAAFTAVNGYDATVIAAEDDELSARLKAAGWKLFRSDRTITWHDAHIHTFRQWWNRSVRAGHGFAEVNSKHTGHFPYVRLKTMIWVGAIPALAVAGAFLHYGLPAAVLGLYPASVARNSFKLWRSGLPLRVAAISAAFMMIGKVPNAQGMALYYWRRFHKRRPTLIEYK